MSVTEVSVHYSAVLTAQHPGTAGQTLAPCCADARYRSDRADTLQWLVSGMLRSTECPVPFVSVQLRSAAIHSHGWPLRLVGPNLDGSHPTRLSLKTCERRTSFSWCAPPSEGPPAHQCRHCGGSRWRLGQRSETSPRAALCALRRAGQPPWGRYQP